MRFSPPADGPEGEKTALFPENRRQQGLERRFLAEKLAKMGGGYPYFGHFLVILGISGENGVQSWPPRGFHALLQKGVLFTGG